MYESSMSNVTQFPLRNERSVKNALKSVESTYKKAGLSREQIAWALDDLKPYLEELLVREKKELAMEIPGGIGLSENQIEVIANAHNKCMRETINHYEKYLGMALSILAGEIASKYVD